MNKGQPEPTEQPPEPTEQIRIVIVDDHAIVRQGLRVLLNVKMDITVVADAASGEEAVRLCSEHTPDVVLMDLVMPGMDGVEATRRIKQASPQTQVVILTSYHEDERILPAIRAGALSYILKDISPADLVTAVRQASQGEAMLHPRVAAQIVQSLHGLRSDLLTPEDPLIKVELTEREQEVLRLVADGHANVQIAARLFISEKTVKFHVSNILRKLELADRTQAAVYAWRKGLM